MSATDRNIGVNGYNLVVVGLMAVIFISLAKVVTSRWPIKGVSDVVAAV